jgi:hypothetical protein
MLLCNVHDRMGARAASRRTVTSSATTGSPSGPANGEGLHSRPPDHQTRPPATDAVAVSTRCPRGDLVHSPTPVPPMELSGRSSKGQASLRKASVVQMPRGDLDTRGAVTCPGGARAATGTEAKPMHPRPPAETKTGHERDDYGRRPGRPPRGVRVGPPGPGGGHRGPAPQGHTCRARGGRELPGADRQDPRLLERRRPSPSVTRPSSSPTRTAFLRTRGEPSALTAVARSRPGVGLSDVVTSRWYPDRPPVANALTGAARRCWRWRTSGDRQPSQCLTDSAHASTAVNGFTADTGPLPAPDDSRPALTRVTLRR